MTTGRKQAPAPKRKRLSKWAVLKCGSPQSHLSAYDDDELSQGVQ